MWLSDGMVNVMIFSDNFLKTKTLTVIVLSLKPLLYLPDQEVSKFYSTMFDKNKMTISESV